MVPKRKLPAHSSPSASSSSSSSSGEDEQEESPLPPAKNSVSKPTAGLSSDEEKEDSEDQEEEEEDEGEEDEQEEDEQEEEDEEGDAEQKGLQAIPKAAPRKDPPLDSESDYESNSDTEPPKEQTVAAQRRHLAPDPSIKPINSKPMKPMKPKRLFDDGDNEDQPSSRPRKHRCRHDDDDDDSLLFLRQAFDAISNQHLKDLVTKNQLKLIDKYKARALEEKFRKIALNKMKYHLKWVDLMKDTMKLVMDALETSE